jgi:hypothetical protein
LLHTENNAAIGPKNTVLPPGILPTGSPFPRTFYFRTHFPFNESLSGLSLVFSNYVDDGAVFYLNGAEIQRLRTQAAPTLITNLSSASAQPAGGDATSPDVFTISGNLLTNLVQGDNVLAVEVHNFSGNGNTDIVFGSALFFSRLNATVPALRIFSEDNLATLYWNAHGFLLQRLGDLSSSNAWADIPGSNSPVTVPATGTMFYRLRQQ